MTGKISLRVNLDLGGGNESENDLDPLNDREFWFKWFRCFSALVDLGQFKPNSDLGQFKPNSDLGDLGQFKPNSDLGDLGDLGVWVKRDYLGELKTPVI